MRPERIWLSGRMSRYDGFPIWKLFEHSSRGALRGAGERLDPAEAVDLDRRDDAFEQLIAFEKGEYHPRRCAEAHGNKGGGQNDEKDEDRIVFKDEGDVAAALD